MLARIISPYPTTHFNSNNVKLLSCPFLTNWNSLITIHANCKRISKLTKTTYTNKRNTSLILKAAYTRKALDAPGAYELIDENTGQKVIVLGGADDPPPDFDVISKLNSGTEETMAADGIELTPEVTKNISPKTRVGKSAGGFGRLKVQRIKALVDRASMMKQETDERDEGEENASSETYGNSHSKLEYMGKKKDGDIYEVNDTENDMDLDYDIELHSEQENNPNEFQKPVTRLKGSEVPKASRSNMRGWSGGGPTPSSVSEPKDLLKQRKKFSFDKDFFSRKAFRDLGCSEYLINALETQLYIRPSHIQAMSFTSVLEGQSCIIADQSGSGKTLAYLAPLVQRLRQEELQGLSKSSSQSPRAVILVPTAELASQVLGNCRSMSKYGVPLRSMVVTGGFKQKTQLENLKGGVDILIATPGRFMYLIKEGFLQLSSLRCAVLDEVDILFDDEDFEVALESLINSSPVTTQYLFVTATLPVDIYNKLVQVFPDCKVITGPSMHRTSPGLEEVLVDCSGEDGSEKSPDTAFQNKKTALLQLADKSPVQKTIVFCNKIETCRKVENALKRIDRKGVHVKVLPFHAALAQEARLANMKEFTASRGKGSMFLVCTDRASRGIDFSAVEHVILFDFPRDPSEYVRRVGRTARGAGGKGKAFVFVVGKQVSLARKIIDRNQKGHPLHDVPGAYELF